MVNQRGHVGLYRAPRSTSFVAHVQPTALRTVCKQGRPVRQQRCSGRGEVRSDIYQKSCRSVSIAFNCKLASHHEGTRKANVALVQKPREDKPIIRGLWVKPPILGQETSTGVGMNSVVSIASWWHISSHSQHGNCRLERTHFGETSPPAMLCSKPMNYTLDTLIL